MKAQSYAQDIVLHCCCTPSIKSLASFYRGRKICVRGFEQENKLSEEACQEICWRMYLIISIVH